MAETFDDAGYELGAEYYSPEREIVWQYIYPVCHKESPVGVRFEGKKGELPSKIRLECSHCGAQVVTLPLAQDGREALVLRKPREA